jgi:hypothetical protein
MSSNFGLPSFYANTRQGEAARDIQGHHETSKTNVGFMDWLQGGGCGNSKGIAVASEHPGMVPQGGFGNTPGGCGIDIQSDLIFGAPGTARFKGPKQTFARPFATTPNLSLGSIEGIEDQSRVMFGQSTANRKSIQTVTDKQFPVFEPLISERQADIPENNYFVEPFLRGGQASRLIPRTRVDLLK